MELATEHRSVLRLRRKLIQTKIGTLSFLTFFSPENSEILQTARQSWWERFTSRLAGCSSLACCPICKSARPSTWVPSRSHRLTCARPHVLVFSRRSAPCALPCVREFPCQKPEGALGCSLSHTRKCAGSTFRTSSEWPLLLKSFPPPLSIDKSGFPFSWEISNWGIHAHPLGEKPFYCDFNLDVPGGGQMFCVFFLRMPCFLWILVLWPGI